MRAVYEINTRYVISSYLDPSKRVSNLRTYFIYCFSARNMNQHCQCTHLRRTSNEIYICENADTDNSRASEGDDKLF